MEDHGKSKPDFERGLGGTYMVTGPAKTTFATLRRTTGIKPWVRITL